MTAPIGVDCSHDLLDNYAFLVDASQLFSLPGQVSFHVCQPLLFGFYLQLNRFLFIVEVLLLDLVYRLLGSDCLLSSVNRLL